MRVSRFHFSRTEVRRCKYFKVQINACKYFEQPSIGKDRHMRTKPLIDTEDVYCYIQVGISIKLLIDLIEHKLFSL